ncbi:hypothetical protein OSTOST_16052, partial [Ostertagia ostertagi]
VNETEAADGSTTVLTSATSPVAEELSDTTTADNVTGNATTTPLQVVETTSTAEEQLSQGTSSPTLVGELTTTEEGKTTSIEQRRLPRLRSQRRGKKAMWEKEAPFRTAGTVQSLNYVFGSWSNVNATTPETTTGSPMNCTDIVNPKTGRSDLATERKEIADEGQVCFDEFAKNGQGFCTQANVLRMCEHRNLKTRAATRNRCPVACGVCVPGMEAAQLGFKSGKA